MGFWEWMEKKAEEHGHDEAADRYREIQFQIKAAGASLCVVAEKTLNIGYSMRMLSFIVLLLSYHVAWMGIEHVVIVLVAGTALADASYTFLERFDVRRMEPEDAKDMAEDLLGGLMEQKD